MGISIVNRWWFFLSVCSLLLLSAATGAHEFEPTTAEVYVYSPSVVNLSVEVDLIELVAGQLDMDGDGKELISAVRALPFADIVRAVDGAKNILNEQLEVYVDGTQLRLQAFESASPIRIYELIKLDPNSAIYRTAFYSKAGLDGGSELQFRFPQALGTVSLYIVSPSQMLVVPNELSSGYLMEAGGIQGFSTKAATAVNYAHHGFRHVVPLGLDHILFVVALCLLSIRVSTLVWQISAFTLAHTLTLGLSSAGIISLSSDIVEPLIALSIAWVAIENLIAKKLHYWRILIVFLFGLLHGLGFAGALKGLGLSSSQWLTSLISFNLGVELGQILVVALTLLMVYWWRDKRWYPRFVQTPLCLMIGAMGLFWAVQRII